MKLFVIFVCAFFIWFVIWMNIYLLVKISDGKMAARMIRIAGIVLYWSAIIATVIFIATAVYTIRGQSASAIIYSPFIK